MPSSNTQHHPTRAGPAASAEPLRGPQPPLDFTSGTMRDLSSAPWAMVLGAVATPQGRCCSKCRAGVPQGAGEHELPGRSRKVRSQFPAFHSDFLQLRWLRVALLIVKKYRGSLARNREQRTLPSSKNSPKHSQTEHPSPAGPAPRRGAARPGSGWLPFGAVHQRWSSSIQGVLCPGSPRQSCSAPHCWREAGPCPGLC